MKSSPNRSKSYTSCNAIHLIIYRGASDEVSFCIVNMISSAHDAKVYQVMRTDIGHIIP